MTATDLASPWKMRKDELLSELRSYGVVAHMKWTVPELHHLTIEQRKERGIGIDQPDPMAGITKKKLEELMADARELGMELPPKPTRGLLIRMLRDAKNTADETIINFGRFAVYFYREVPQSYRVWAMRETSGPRERVKVGVQRRRLLRESTSKKLEEALVCWHILLGCRWSCCWLTLRRWRQVPSMTPGPCSSQGTVGPTTPAM